LDFFSYEVDEDMMKMMNN